MSWQEDVRTVLDDTTQQFRKGAEVTDETAYGVRVRHIYAMPHVDDAEGLEMVDVHFMVVGVDVEEPF